MINVSLRQNFSNPLISFKLKNLYLENKNYENFSNDFIGHYNTIIIDHSDLRGDEFPVQLGVLRDLFGTNTVGLYRI